jgi:dienelactone hydrolase
MGRTFGTLLIVAATSAYAADQPPLVFDANSVGPPRSHAQLELWRPSGAGPFPAVVVLHGCGGVGAGSLSWAERLAGWGYLAAVVDSLGPRKLDDICANGWVLSSEVRAQDAFNAATHLRTLRDIDADRIGVIGFSHGGTSTIAAALADAGSPFQAAVAFYPYCPTALPKRFSTDLLIVIGQDDELNPADRCRYFVEENRDVRHAPAIKIYPGAAHAFDVPGLNTLSAGGSRMRENPEAAADSFEVTRRFLAEHLGKK